MRNSLLEYTESSPSQVAAAAMQAAAYDKKLGVFDDEPCMGCSTEESKKTYWESYREVNPSLSGN